MNENKIVFEQGRFWVMDCSIKSRPAYTVMKAQVVASTSVQSFARTEDGLSLAIAYCKYLQGKESGPKTQ